MKKLLSLILLFCLLVPGALADFYHTTKSVTSCEKTSAMYDKFYAAGELSVRIPGCAQDFVPQGLAYLAEENWMLFAG